MSARFFAVVLLSFTLFAAKQHLPISALEDGRGSLIGVAKRASLAAAERRVGHLSHSCNLRIDGETYPVLDLFEEIYGAAVRRGVAWILVLSPKLKLVQRIQYDPQNRPLGCDQNRLYVSGELSVELKGEGNELVFSNHGASFQVERVEAARVPPVFVTQTAISPNGSPESPAMEAMQRGRMALLELVQSAFPEGSAFVHASHTCNLRIDGHAYPVVDVRERKRGSPNREVNSLLIFSPTLTPLHRIAYDDERPMFCRANRLYLFRSLELRGRGTGNELTFSDGGRSLSVKYVEPLDQPAVELSETLQ